MGQITKVKDKREYIVTLADEEYCDSPADILIGGDDATTDGKFVPNINMIKWDDEAWININQPLSITNEVETFDGSTITLEWGDSIIKYWITADGKLEYEITLLSRPAQNVITLSVDWATGLSWFYQPTLYNSWLNDNEGLTWKEYQLYDHRPPNVEGSYAIYFNKKNNEYKTGKFCHIYRPELTDALGAKSWADLKLDVGKKELTITMDRTWLRDATYPVIIDPYIGYNTQGASNYGAAGVKRGTMTTTDASGGDTTTWYICMEGYDATSNGVKVGVYPTSAGEPEGQSLVEQAEFSITATGWSNTAATGATLSASTEYWTGKIPEHNDNDVYYDEAGSSWYITGRTYADEMAATCQTGGSTKNREWSLYLEYSSGAAGGMSTVIGAANYTTRSKKIKNTGSNGLWWIRNSIRKLIWRFLYGMKQRAKLRLARS